jgi:hypothetical protein
MGWLSREDAARLAGLLMTAIGPRFKSCHVQGMGTGGRIKLTAFLTPLASKDIPEPEPFIFTPRDLAPPVVAYPGVHDR